MREETKKELETYCGITGQNEDEVIDAALDRFLYPYAPDEGYPKKGVHIKGTMPYERKAAENEGRNPEITEVSCWILGETTIYGEPYIRIMEGGNLLKVPKAYAKVIE